MSRQAVQRWWNLPHRMRPLPRFAMARRTPFLPMATICSQLLPNQVVSLPLSAGRYRRWCRYGHPQSDGDLKAKMDKAISSMKADGSLNKMISKWFGEDANLF